MQHESRLSVQIILLSDDRFPDTTYDSSHIYAICSVRFSVFVSFLSRLPFSNSHPRADMIRVNVLIIESLRVSVVKNKEVFFTFIMYLSYLISKSDANLYNTFVLDKAW